MKAVIWTDVFQCAVMILGMLTVMIKVVINHHHRICQCKDGPQR